MYIIKQNEYDLMMISLIKQDGTFVHNYHCTFYITVVDGYMYMYVPTMYIHVHVLCRYIHVHIYMYVPTQYIYMYIVYTVHVRVHVYWDICTYLSLYIIHYCS